MRNFDWLLWVIALINQGLNLHPGHVQGAGMDLPPSNARAMLHQLAGAHSFYLNAEPKQAGCVVRGPLLRGYLSVFAGRLVGALDAVLDSSARVAPFRILFQVPGSQVCSQIASGELPSRADVHWTRAAGEFCSFWSLQILRPEPGSSCR